MRKKVIFIPGWMYNPSYFRLSEGLNPWKEDVEIEKKDAEIIVAHSMGATIALDAWSHNNKLNLILVDPFIERKSLLLTFFDWLKYILFEGTSNRECYVGNRYLFRDFLVLFRLKNKNYWNIIKKIPLDKITVLHGDKDLYLSSNKLMRKFRSLNVRVIEVNNAGHNWHKNFDKEILKIINS